MSDIELSSDTFSESVGVIKCRKCNFECLSVNLIDGLCYPCRPPENPLGQCTRCHKVTTIKMLNKNYGTCIRCNKITALKIYDSKSLRLSIWNHYFGDNSVKCPLCHINNINILTFDMGHDVADSKGGLRDVYNIMPICRSCNCDQGDLLFHEFKRIIPKLTIEYDKLTYDHRIKLVRIWCREKNDNMLNDNLIHKIAYKKKYFDHFITLFNYKNIIYVYINWRGKISLSHEK